MVDIIISSLKNHIQNFPSHRELLHLIEKFSISSRISPSHQEFLRCYMLYPGMQYFLSYPILCWSHNVPTAGHWAATCYASAKGWCHNVPTAGCWATTYCAGCWELES